MKYTIDFTDTAMKIISFFKKAGQNKLLGKAFELIQKIAEHPFPVAESPNL